MAIHIACLYLRVGNGGLNSVNPMLLFSSLICYYVGVCV